MAAVTSTRASIQGCVTEPLGLMRYRAVAAPGFVARWTPRYPGLVELAEIADGTLVELAPRHPVDVALYWQRWNLASPLLDAVSRAVREAAATALYPF